MWELLDQAAVSAALVWSLWRILKIFAKPKKAASCASACPKGAKPLVALGRRG